MTLGQWRRGRVGRDSYRTSTRREQRTLGRHRVVVGARDSPADGSPARTPGGQGSETTTNGAKARTPTPGPRTTAMGDRSQQTDCAPPSWSGRHAVPAIPAGSAPSCHPVHPAGVCEPDNLSTAMRRWLLCPPRTPFVWGGLWHALWPGAQTIRHRTGFTTVRGVGWPSLRHPTKDRQFAIDTFHCRSTGIGLGGSTASCSRSMNRARI